MSGQIFSAYHQYVATTLAREMNAYLLHACKMQRYFDERDRRGNPPVYRQTDRQETEERRLRIVVFCAIYVEALANLYLSLKLTNKQFAAIDRIETVEKWATIPSLFLPDYELPRSEVLFRDLKMLFTHRNAVAHMKPRITAGAAVIHEGNLPKKMNIHSLIESWDRLPATLIQNLGKHDHSLEFGKFKALSLIDEYLKIRNSVT